MGVIFERRDSEDDQDQYLVDHSSAVLLTNPAGQLQAVFSAPHNADRLKNFQAVIQSDREYIQPSARTVNDFVFRRGARISNDPSGPVSAMFS